LRLGHGASLGESALEGGAIGRPAVCEEHVLHWKLEQQVELLATCPRVMPSWSHRGLIWRPCPQSTSVSPAMTAFMLSTKSTKSFFFCPGNASTPTGRRSPAPYQCASDGSVGSHCGCGASQCQRPGRNSRTARCY
jgi:hypothetical protein